MSAFAVRCGDSISLLARIVTFAKPATSGNETRDAGDGTHPAPIACGRRILYGVREVTMRVRVKLFASLCRYFSDAAPGIPFEMEVPGGATVADLVDRLKLPREEVKVFFVNGRGRSMDWPLEAGDDVGIFPLIAGG